MAVVSPNMNLVLPTVGIDSGLVWEQAADSNALTIDQHNHTSGFGVQIPPAGLNINTDLSFNTNSAVNLKSTTYIAQSSFATLLSLYVIGNDLYYNDGAANVIRLTSGGTVNATSSGIASGSATAAFNTGVLVVDSAANTPANIQAGSILLGNNIASSKFLTLSPPAAMAANYTLVLPNIPGSLSFMTLDASGNMGTASNVSGAQIIAGSITGSQIANATITTTQINGSAGITGGQIAANTITGGPFGNLASSLNLTGIPTVGGNSQPLVIAANGASFPASFVWGTFHTVSGSTGVGATVSHTGTGTYTITFTTAFTTAPSVTITPINTITGGLVAVLTTFPSTTQALVEFWTQGSSPSLDDTSFCYQAIG